ncbi:exportin 1 [Dorcoceras hygrometricum]|uniref:Exportin 1 n=1 Tax=Dorcoceras hygrometricum TaxID=472368 RepID=A0A2Z7B792_9LAMI|nr:exportin 1 [Dorcoceras hygrometricum]
MDQQMREFRVTSCWFGKTVEEVERRHFVKLKRCVLEPAARGFLAIARRCRLKKSIRQRFAFTLKDSADGLGDDLEPADSHSYRESAGSVVEFEKKSAVTNKEFSSWTFNKENPAADDLSDANSAATRNSATTRNSAAMRNSAATQASSSPRKIAIQEVKKSRKMELERERSAGALSVDDISSDVIIQQEATVFSRKLSADEKRSERDEATSWFESSSRKISAGSLYIQTQERSDVVEEEIQSQATVHQQMIFGDSDSKTMSFT